MGVAERYEGMNAVDLVIVGSVGVLALIGLKTGMMKPVTGLGGFVMGALVGFQLYSEVAVLLEGFISGAILRNVVAYAGIVLVIAGLGKLVTIMFRSFLSSVFVGWMDRAAGALGGALIGLAVVGTMVYLISGANVESTRNILDSSILAPKITKASLLSASAPMCSSLGQQATETECTSLTGLISELTGYDVNAKLQSMAGEQDVDSIVVIVKGVLTGDPQAQFAQLGAAPSVNY